jgi:hypothetical protein
MGMFNHGFTAQQDGPEGQVRNYGAYQLSYPLAYHSSLRLALIFPFNSIQSAKTRD